MTRRSRRPSQRKELYYIVSILVLVALTVLTIWGPGGWIDVKRAQTEMEKHAERVEAVKQRNQQRIERIRSLKSDPQALEGYARQKGYGRRGEIIQQLPEEAPPTR